MTATKATVRLLILDLDNTLYDWVGYFVPAFDAMLESAASILDIARDDLRSSVRDVHTRHGNTEHPFALLEADAVVASLPGLSRVERYEYLRPAFETFDAEKTSRLKLYEGVWGTLEKVRLAGTTIVGHTDAASVSARSRVRLLQLDEFLSRIYATAFWGESHPDARSQSSDTQFDIVELGTGERKPNPDAVRKILADYKCTPDEALYVGDNEDKDLVMAEAAGVQTAWAEYGTRHDPAQWARLLDLTHWRALAPPPSTEPEGVKADRTTLSEFSDLTTLFSFGPLRTA